MARSRVLATVPRAVRQDAGLGAPQGGGAARKGAETERGLAWGSRACSCHEEEKPIPDWLGGGKTRQGNPSLAAWYHLPGVRAYFIGLLIGDFAFATECLMEHALRRGRGNSYMGLVEAFDIAEEIGDLDRARALAWLTVNETAQHVYFFARRVGIADPELLDRARKVMIEQSPTQARWCAKAHGDHVFLGMIKRHEAALT